MERQEEQPQPPGEEEDTAGSQEEGQGAEEHTLPAEEQGGTLRARAVRGGDVLKGRLCSDFVLFCHFVILRIIPDNLTLLCIIYVFRHGVSQKP